MAGRRAWLWVGQGVLAVLVITVVARTVLAHWEEFQALELAVVPRAGPIVLAALAIWLTYGVLIAAWRQILSGWGQQLPYSAAARIWCLSNLGRYLPGKVWSVAGLVVLAQRAGVKGWTAAASAATMQVLAVGTGAGVVALGAPGAVSPAQTGLAVLIAALTLAVLVWEPAGPRLLRAVFPSVEPRPLSPSTAATATLGALASWVGYGAAFWLLAQGLLPVPSLPLGRAVAIFAAGYLVGLLSLFAPGGVGVRELMLVALLTPVLGSGGAVVLTVASRLLLTATEAAAAFGTVLLVRRTTGTAGDTS